MTNVLLVVAVLAVMALTVVLISQNSKVKKALSEIEFEKKSISEKEGLLLKEARIKAKEELQSDREKLNEEERERRQEFARLEQKLTKKRNMLEDKIQEYTEKDLQAQRKLDELLEKEDYLASIVQKQTEELERISGLSADDAKRMLLEQIKNDLAQEPNAINKRKRSQNKRGFTGKSKRNSLNNNAKMYD